MKKPGVSNSTVDYILLSVIGFTLIVLKATRIIDWPWIWVLAPFWWPLALFGALIVIGVIIAFLTTLMEKK